MPGRYTTTSISHAVHARINARKLELTAEKKRPVGLSETLEVILDESDRYRQVTGCTTTREKP